MNFIIIILSLLIVPAKLEVAKNETSNSESPRIQIKFNLREVISNVGRSLEQFLNANGIQIGVNRSANVNKPSETLRSEESSIRSNNNSQELKEEIARHSSDLQKVINDGVEVLKQRGDSVAKRMLEELNLRLDGAKSRASRILSEPQNTEMAVKALKTVDQGIGELNNLVQNVLNRANVTVNVEVTRNSS